MAAAAYMLRPRRLRDVVQHRGPLADPAPPRDREDLAPVGVYLLPHRRVHLDSRKQVRAPKIVAGDRDSLAATIPVVRPVLSLLDYREHVERVALGPWRPHPPLRFLGVVEGRLLVSYDAKEVLPPRPVLGDELRRRVLALGGVDEAVPQPRVVPRLPWLERLLMHDPKEVLPPLLGRRVRRVGLPLGRVHHPVADPRIRRRPLPRRLPVGQDLEQAPGPVSWHGHLALALVAVDEGVPQPRVVLRHARVVHRHVVKEVRAGAREGWAVRPSTRATSRDGLYDRTPACLEVLLRLLEVALLLVPPLRDGVRLRDPHAPPVALVPINVRLRRGVGGLLLRVVLIPLVAERHKRVEAREPRRL
mmetsp:Transcript_16146/g.50751  ORF Transcript_16146/g.50751 Transcript_16146/m.50751 type:complete len:361 (-) Transcript_16146:108-1190(-)